MNEFTLVGQNIADSFMSIIRKFIEIIPDIIGALVVLLIGIFIAKLILKLIKQLFKAIKLETLSEKLSIDDKIKSAGINITLSGMLAGLIYWIVLLVFISASAQILNIEVVTLFVNKLISWLPAIFAGLAIMIVGVMAAEALGNVLENVKYGKTYKTVVRWFILIIALITALEQIGLEISFLTENIQIVVAGIDLAFGLAFGLVGKERAKDFLDRHLK